MSAIPFRQTSGCGERPARLRSRSRWTKEGWLLMLVILVVGLPITQSSAAELLTLERALGIALQQNPDLLAARQELEIARGPLVRSRYLNRFNPTAEGGVFSREFAEGGSGPQYELSLSQEVEIAGQRGLRIEEAQRNLKRVEALVRDRERLLEGAVKRAFYTALLFRERLTLLRKIETFNRRIRDAASERFKAGVTPIMEANLAEIRYGQSRKETLTAEAFYQAALFELRRVLGLSPERSIEPTGELRGIPKKVELANLLARALKQRPDLMAANREIERVEAETALTKRLIVPNLTFQAFYLNERERVSSRSDKIVGGGISIPLPFFDRKQGELVSLAGQRSRGQHRAAATSRNIEREVATAVREYEAARRSLEIFESDVLNRIDENFRFVEIAYREGKIDLLGFIVVQNDLIKTQLSYFDSLGQFRTAEANLDQAVGGTF